MPECPIYKERHFLPTAECYQSETRNLEIDGKRILYWINYEKDAPELPNEAIVQGTFTSNKNERYAFVVRVTEKELEGKIRESLKQREGDIWISFLP